MRFVFTCQVGLAYPYIFFGNDAFFSRVENMQDFGVTCMDVVLVHDVSWLTLGWLDAFMNVKSKLLICVHKLWYGMIVLNVIRMDYV